MVMLPRMFIFCASPLSSLSPCPPSPLVLPVLFSSLSSRPQASDIRLTPSLMNACGLELQQFCRDVPPSGGQAFRCLQLNMEKVRERGWGMQQVAVSGVTFNLPCSKWHCRLLSRHRSTSRPCVTPVITPYIPPLPAPTLCTTGGCVHCLQGRSGAADVASVELLPHGHLSEAAVRL